MLLIATDARARKLDEQCKHQKEDVYAELRILLLLIINLLLLNFEGLFNHDLSRTYAAKET